METSFGLQTMGAKQYGSFFPKVDHKKVTYRMSVLVEASCLCSNDSGTLWECAPILRTFHVPVFIPQPLGFTESDSIDNGGMVQFIGDHSILCSKQHLKDTSICIETAGV